MRKNKRRKIGDVSKSAAGLELQPRRDVHDAEWTQEVPGLKDAAEMVSKSGGGGGDTVINKRKQANVYYYGGK